MVETQGPSTIVFFTLKDRRMEETAPQRGCTKAFKSYKASNPHPRSRNNILVPPCEQASYYYFDALSKYSLNIGRTGHSKFIGNLPNLGFGYIPGYKYYLRYLPQERNQCMDAIYRPPLLQKVLSQKHIR
jgi:hypothetical protein